MALPKMSLDSDDWSEPEPKLEEKKHVMGLVGPPHCCPTCGADTLRKKDSTCTNSLCHAFVPRGAGVFSP